jgi:hypothetical protein
MSESITLPFMLVYLKESNLVIPASFEMGIPYGSGLINESMNASGFQVTVVILKHL